MTNHVSGYIAAFALFIVTGVFALFALLIVDIFLAPWRRRDLDEDDEDDEDESGWNGGGGGGWTDKPSGRPPGGGGPDRDMDRQFNELADAVGKTMQIEKNEGEKVLT